ncbi:D-alanyl-D-alanine-carboxypeptidase/endopeptidase AmpH [Citrobacter sp. RHB25-C09]|uniref:D-alanyl-D-alanine- carboxypeptidase/endopeptidase AmpH n=1 Tax=Citrobacter sp. RHB25-C09 TaxID=2742624 RepID=UPI0015EFB50C|nr:D-alanyl-D-alanine-carboxypeptidase/endopeptidase AmpH [Citrobacter sp. RHB25-C09]QMI04272.1 D-alanyl-D-alanine-carboxypeptidase/endopeptidase AmpH [Citrobacter sp. RHB25-C09]
MKRSLLFSAVLYTASLTPVQAVQPIADPVFASDIVERYADHIFYGSAATGMALVVIDGNQRVFRSFGETRPGNNVRPQLDSVIRIASITKLMTSEMLVKMLDQGKVQLNDPLSKYAPPGARVPTYQGTPIRLVNLATHTSALPREQPGGAAKRPVFVWPTREQRWNYLSTATLKTAPGTQAAYSNLAFDLLADALANASGKPYTQLFEENITRPLGMKDTTFTPSPDQCKRLMVAEKGASPCNNTLAAVGSGGVYSTPGDMMRWMQQYLSSDFYQRSNQADRMQTLIYQRTQLSRVTGMDVPGKADALGLGWVYMAPKNGRPGIIQKTGGGGGFITYMAMIPQKNVGAFIVVTRSPQTRFTNMSNGINDLVVELSENKPVVVPAS